MRPLVARSHRICNSVTGEVAVAFHAAAVVELARRAARAPDQVIPSPSRALRLIVLVFMAPRYDGRARPRYFPRCELML